MQSLFSAPALGERRYRGLARVGSYREPRGYANLFYRIRRLCFPGDGYENMTARPLFSIRQLTVADVNLMKALLAVFGEAFDDPET
jgi:hypothetical protein